MTVVRGYSAEELRALADAGIALTSELGLDAVLQRLVEIARELVGTRYAALSVVGPEGKIERFFFSGISEEQRQRIGDLPRGRGLLGVLLREGASLRLEDINNDPRSAGFPPNHPPMKSLLGVPVVCQGHVIGNLYLTEKRDAGSFDERDEEIVRLLAAQASVAIQNAQLYETRERHIEEWKALLELGQEVTASPDLQRLLDSTVARARRLLGTDTAALMLLRNRDNLAMAAHEGLQSAAIMDARPLAKHGLQKLALTTMSPVIVSDYETDERLEGRPATFVEEERLVSLICVPLQGKEGPLGTLTVGNRRPTTFDIRQAELLEALANWAAVAIETSRLYDKLEGVARLEERERIAMDLHDGVIQCIYAVGLHLEDCIDRLDESPGEVKLVLEKGMDDLHQVIRDIRSYIFDLRPRVSQVADLPDAIRQLVEDVRVNTLMTATVEITHSFDGLLDEDQALGLFHIAQEALNNVAKHSKASSVHVMLAVNDGRVTLGVEDNGIGFETPDEGSGEKHGLRNIRDRARSLGAILSMDAQPGRGTRVTVELPVGRRKG